MLPDKWQSPQCFYGCITTMPLHPNAILLVRELIQQHIILLCVDEIVAYIEFPPIFNIANMLIGFVPMMLLYYLKPTLSIG